MRSLVVAASVVGVGSLAVRQFTTLLDTHLLNVRVSAWTQAAVLFALGVIAAEAGWDGRLSRHTEHRLGQVTVAGVGLIIVLVSYTGPAISWTAHWGDSTVRVRRSPPSTASSR